MWDEQPNDEFPVALLRKHLVFHKEVEIVSSALFELALALVASSFAPDGRDNLVARTPYDTAAYIVYQLCCSVES
jgi:hypothetical protein